MSLKFRSIEGYRNVLDDFRIVVRDVATSIKMLYEYPEVDENIPIYIIGASMGGLLAAIFTLEWQENPNLIPGNFKGLILLVTLIFSFDITCYGKSIAS